VAALDAAPDLEGYDAIVIGASIRHGKHDPSVLAFIRRHQTQLAAKPSGFFSVSLVARKPAKNRPETNPYLKAFVASSPWKPRLLGVFGGELDYQRYGAFDRAAIRFIMWLTKGPRDPHAKVEFTDWGEVERFAGRVAELAAGGSR
jgi:menaquinone-dependent protoporphyrinogen oxidase